MALVQMGVFSMYQGYLVRTRELRGLALTKSLPSKGGLEFGSHPNLCIIYNVRALSVPFGSHWKVLAPVIPLIEPAAVSLL